MKPHEFVRNDLGWTFKTDELLTHFGSVQLSRQNLSENFSSIQKFAFVHQVHGNTVACVDDGAQDGIQADAMISAVKNTALCIKTADCAPVMIFDPIHKKIGAIHAGWRGVANKIVEKTVVKMREQYGSEVSECVFLVGPHIQKSSFEVEGDVRDVILETLSANLNKSIFYQANSNGRFLVDINAVLLAQIGALGGGKVLNLKEDTFTNENLHSYRRDKQNSGRLISFIALL